MTRREAREQALALIFELGFAPETDVGELISDAELCRDEKIDDYARALAEKFSGNRVFIDDVISRFSTKWKLDRLPRTTAAILRLAICELDYVDDVPVGACINEAVELAKKYGSDDDPAYVNGVLGGYVRSGECRPAAAGASPAAEPEPLEKANESV